MSGAKFELINKNVVWSPRYRCCKKFRKPQFATLEDNFATSGIKEVIW